MSASSAGPKEVRLNPVPAQSDPSLRCGSAACNPDTAPLFAQRRAPGGTVSAPVHHRLDGKDASPSKIVRRERRNLTVLCFLLHKTPNDLGLNPAPQILPALLIERRIVPVVIPAALVQASIPAFIQSGTGMVGMWPPLPTKRPFSANSPFGSSTS
jgi:hypothetical protein